MRALPWNRARTLAAELATPPPPENVPIGDAAGRVLAEPLRALVAVPGFDNAAMDGYAVRGAGPWRLTGRVLAGCPDPGALAERTAVEIATGAPVPAGADRVVPYEEANREGGLVAIRADAGRAWVRDHIRRRGEDAEPGDELLPAGSLVTPVVLGMAGSVGADTVSVVPRPRARVLLTGDEIVRAGLPGPGQVRDALGPLLPPLLAGFGADVTGVSVVGDASAAALTAALAATTEEIAVVCGASSVGPVDHLHAALAGLVATVHVNGVACRPGRPQVLAHRPDRGTDTGWIVGLPGNPYAALVAAYTLLAPLVAGLTGRGLPGLPTVAVSGQARPVPGLTRLVPVRWDDSGAVVVPRDGAGYLGAAAQADALAVIEPDWTPHAPARLILQC
ncbi:molybdopterin molybdotransferase MoeA [Rugosimonospora africana]|uniref:Molybdopterin molybdenumtransferase n=1 Tax=Rugosimonospora africana TaxID=556532 RepID=A0A8J3QUU4_9ACTN|nr:molybdopterin molybdotransferase MoeA [Rugosimonospora africana]GIH16220.1 molybdopterin molybdenumtransferase MoeA [Rugosimonospora africana]